MTNDKYQTTKRMLPLICAMLLAVGADDAEFAATQQREIGKGELQDPLSFAVDEKAGEIVVADTGHNRLAIFNLDGRLVKSIGPAAGLSEPMGVAVDDKGIIFVSEMSRSAIKVLGVRGDVQREIDLSEWVSEGTEKPEATRPGRMAFDADGNLAVIDRANQRILVIDREGKRKRAFGRRGKEQGEFLMLQAIAVTKEKKFLLTSSLGTAVHFVDRDGTFRSRFGSHGSGESGFSFPAGIAVDRSGNIWVADSFQHTLKIFNTDGKPIASRGAFGIGAGKFHFPVDIAFGVGRLYTLEKGSGLVKIFEMQ